MTYWIVLCVTYVSSLIKKKSFDYLIQIILFIMSAFISPHVSHDFQNYFNGYYNLSNGFFPEPLSKVIFNGAKKLGFDISVSFFVLAILSIFLKIKALRNLGLPISLFMLIYFSKLFLLLDLTQVRAGVAVSLCLLAFDSYTKNKKINAALYIFFAFLFHLSSIMYFVIFLFNRNKPNVIFWISLLLVGICISLINIKSQLVMLMMFMHAPESYYVYLNSDSDFSVNPFNTLAIANASIFLMFCVFNKRLDGNVMHLAFKLYGVSIVSFYVFIDFPVLSFRISEFFLVYQVILLCGLMFSVKTSQRWIYITLIFLYSLAQLYLTYNKAGIIEPYAMSIF
ncbi:EpsG family protein [Enterobacter kobei]|uniref:EpsG family protein n=2 Tax=Enterobacter kobei TaxID=208224 RepID=UPI003BD2BF6B